MGSLSYSVFMKFMYVYQYISRLLASYVFVDDNNSNMLFSLPDMYVSN